VYTAVLAVSVLAVSTIAAPASAVAGERAKSQWSIQVISSPKKLVLGSAKERGCGKALRVKVRGPELDNNELMSLWTTATVVGGSDGFADTEFTNEVYPGRARTIFPHDEKDICGFLVGLLTVPGKYKIRIKIEAVVRSRISVHVAETTIPVTVKYTRYYG